MADSTVPEPEAEGTMHTPLYLSMVNFLPDIKVSEKILKIDSVLKLTTLFKS